MIPPLHPGSCQLWWAPATAAGPHLLEPLDDDERRRQAGFMAAEDRSRFLVAHALARLVAAHHAGIGPRAIGYAASHGKPRLADPASALELSISHSGAWVVVAIGREGALGVDVERIAGAAPDAALLASALSDAEQRAYRAVPFRGRPWAFCRYWTRKEAVLKATGDGLGIPPALIAVTAPDTAPALVRWSGPRRPATSVHISDVDAPPGYAAALATLAAKPRVTHHAGSRLLEALA